MKKSIKKGKDKKKLNLNEFAYKMWNMQNTVY